MKTLTAYIAQGVGFIASRYRCDRTIRQNASFTVVCIGDYCDGNATGDFNAYVDGQDVHHYRLRSTAKVIIGRSTLLDEAIALAMNYFERGAFVVNARCYDYAETCDACDSDASERCSCDRMTIPVVFRPLRLVIRNASGENILNAAVRKEGQELVWLKPIHARRKIQRLKKAAGKLLKESASEASKDNWRTAFFLEKRADELVAHSVSCDWAGTAQQALAIASQHNAKLKIAVPEAVAL